MSPPASGVTSRLVLFVLLLAVAFGVGLGAGRAVGPLGADPPPGREMNR